MLKLRAWFNQKPRWANQMFYSDEETPGLGDWFCEVETHFNKYGGGILMQYTGLPDKNKKEVYQGDRLKYEVKGFPVRTVVVEALPGRFTFYWEDEKDGESHTNPLYVYNAECWEIIGNIYENPGGVGHGERG